MAHPACARPIPFYHWTETDYQALRDACTLLKCKPEHMLLLMYLETGGSLNPFAAFCNSNGEPTAVGLIQFTESTNGILGLTNEQRRALLYLTPAEQMPFVVRYFQHWMAKKPPASYPPDAVTLYQYVIGPGTVGSEVIYKQNVNPCPPPSSAKDAYCANIGLDTKPRDGVIDRHDLAVVLDGLSKHSAYKRAIQELKGELPVIDIPPPTAPAQASIASAFTDLGFYPSIALAGLAALGGYAVYRARSHK